jgi:hypothetical protein
VPRDNGTKLVSDSIFDYGNIGIDTTAPNAQLDFEGTVKIGSGGKIFSEIREMTGTLISNSGIF